MISWSGKGVTALTMLSFCSHRSKTVCSLPFFFGIQSIGTAWCATAGIHHLSRDDLFSALKTSQGFSNSDLRHLWHSSDSNCLQVPETLWSTSYSEPLLAVPNTTAHSLHSDPLSDTPSEDYSKTSTSSKGSLETSLDSIPSDLNSTPMFLGDSPSHSGDKAAPAASNIKGHVVKAIHVIKGQGWSGSVGSAG